MTQRGLAADLGMSIGKVNYCLKALVETGWIKAGNLRRGQDKAKYSYLLTPKGIEENARVTFAFLRRKQAEYDTLKGEIGPLREEAVRFDQSDASN